MRESKSKSTTENNQRKWIFSKSELWSPASWCIVDGPNAMHCIDVNVLLCFILNYSSSGRWQQNELLENCKSANTIDLTTLRIQTIEKCNTHISRYRYLEKKGRQMFYFVYPCISRKYLQMIKFISIMAADWILSWYLLLLFIIKASFLPKVDSARCLKTCASLRSQRKSQRCELLNTEALICRCVYLSPDTFTVVINKQGSVGKSSAPTTKCYSKKKKKKTRVKDAECPVNSDLDSCCPHEDKHGTASSE